MEADTSRIHHLYIKTLFAQQLLNVKMNARLKQEDSFTISKTETLISFFQSKTGELRMQQMIRSVSLEQTTTQR